MQLTGNTILVTGGGTGIGRGLATALHRLGNRVVIAGRRRAPLQAVVSANPGMQYLQLDQGDSDDIRRFTVELTDRFPDLDVVINNAGVSHVEDLTAGDTERAQAIVEVNLLGPIRLTSALLPALVSRPHAAILNVTSGLAFAPNASMPTYCATKAALHSYTQSLRFQLRDTAVQVIEIIPPRVQTELADGLGLDPDTLMPLNSYVAETMSLLQMRPQADEIMVEVVKPQ
ncbi:SDR family NAD(P)-dependent oxidoreductase [Nocardia sp. NEAU-G5]|uniref:SDR family NAD(P)-dependent oxidoreductase n=1 Tax=Nocardia albiluteola TaxID=2842303 RepID=A0ABS6ATG8_9NOCA|nr:SDR family NAD(P)-dependent oxidoreductase [Nocardia albiluteola]MBU3061327.1 SDR family NAD(P)-dependent oxidoreductase [Nocardia albiluteola]